MNNLPALDARKPAAIGLGASRTACRSRRHRRHSPLSQRYLALIRLSAFPLQGRPKRASAPLFHYLKTSYVNHWVVVAKEPHPNDCCHTDQSGCASDRSDCLGLDVPIHPVLPLQLGSGLPGSSTQPCPCTCPPLSHMIPFGSSPVAGSLEFESPLPLSSRLFVMPRP